MPFPSDEREALLKLRGIGPTLLMRLEQIGANSCTERKEFSSAELAVAVAKILDNICWKTSPEAKASLDSAIKFARNQSSK